MLVKTFNPTAIATATWPLHKNTRENSVYGNSSSLQINQFGQYTVGLCNIATGVWLYIKVLSIDST
jgi:hypothetical protein